ncbi:neuronal membrane glycoprotein M6-a isoform X2 [Bacillus rossius redtenbacheri]
MVPVRRKIGLSRESLGRYSEKSLHSEYNLGGDGGHCRNCLTRIPYATLIATIMCIVGVGVFCGTMYRGAMLAVLMFDQVFHLRLIWVEAVQMVFVVIGASMGALGLMILFVGFLATGATRTKVYRAWGARVGGRISCAVFMGITYVLQMAWLLMLCFLVIVTLVFTIFWGLCSNPLVQANRQCIDFKQFGFLFPNHTRPEDMEVCDTHELKLFCKDYVEKAELMFILATVACLLVVLSLVHYLMCLSANYAHIRDHEKFQELQDLQCLQEPEMSYGGSKDRF